MVSVNGQDFNLQLVDTAGQVKIFGNIRSACFPPFFNNYCLPFDLIHNINVILLMGAFWGGKVLQCYTCVHTMCLDLGIFDLICEHQGAAINVWELPGDLRYISCNVIDSTFFFCAEEFHSLCGAEQAAFSNTAAHVRAMLLCPAYRQHRGCRHSAAQNNLWWRKRLVRKRGYT